jgi:NADH:ubiquinone oxidoreductase subunit E
MKEEVYVCIGRSCRDFGAEQIIDVVERIEQYDVVPTGCLGYCERSVNAMKNGKYYYNLTAQNATSELQGAGTERLYPEPLDITDDFLGDM